MRKSTVVPTEYWRNYDRQVDRFGGVPATPDGQVLDRLKVHTSNIAENQSGNAYVMVPSKSNPFYVVTSQSMPLFVPGGAGAVGVDDEVFAYWHPYGQTYVLAATGSGVSAVAITTNVIPARVDNTPGGPVTVTLQKSVTGADFTPGLTVQVYSWVKTPSADPTDEPNGELFIYISRDPLGTWWFIAQDCTEVAASVQTASASANLLLTTSPQAVPGTTLTVQNPGIHNYNYQAELEIIGMAAGQAWDAVVGAYNLTEAAWVFQRHYAGSGPLDYNPITSGSGSFEFVDADVGDDIVLGGFRAGTTQGTITIIAANTDHQLTGPIK